MSIKTISVDSVIYRKDLYPRLETSAVTVQKYAEDISVLPPIEVNQAYELLDGWHRWKAHIKAGAKEISATITKTASDAASLEIAIERNSTHGLQMSQEDKRDVARKIYHATPEKERVEKKKRLAEILSVGLSTVHEWLSRIDKDSKEARNKRIFDLWLACWTHDEIADEVGISRPAVAEVLSEIPDLEKLTKSDKSAAEHATDFKPPIYNIWKQQEKTSGSSHFGNSEITWVDNLLYLYTSPFDVVIDPFAGGGSTIDICKKRFRRYFVSDRKPVDEREDIRLHDLTDGLPKPPQWKDVRLVYLDPPYWKQAEGKYSKDATDLANMELDAFTSTLSGIVSQFSKKLTDARIALLIQPTQWNAPERRCVDHVGDLLRAVKLPVEMRISCPYESQQCNAQMVQWAKDNKQVLVLTRELIVWRIE